MNILDNFHSSTWGMPAQIVSRVEAKPDPQDPDCWTSRVNTSPPVKDRQRKAAAEYLASIPTTFISPRMNNPANILRAKKVADFNRFMMNHPWRKRGLDDMEEENKEAYDRAYESNPQHVADKRAFEEAEARISNKNSILKAVMTDPGLALLDYENKEPDQVELLQRSNQSYVSSRDKYFIPPRPVGERTSARDDAFLNHQADEMAQRLNESVGTL